MKTPSRLSVLFASLSLVALLALGAGAVTPGADASWPPTPGPTYDRFATQTPQPTLVYVSPTPNTAITATPYVPPAPSATATPVTPVPFATLTPQPTATKFCRFPGGPCL